MKGYLFNSLLVLGGSTIGIFIGKKIREQTKDAVFNALGLATLFIGITMSLKGTDILPIVFCLVLGSLGGSIIRLEDRVNDYLGRLNTSYFAARYNTEGFLVASILFCVGSLTIIGSLKDGLYNDGTLIKTKAILDAFAALLLASRYGVSVAFAAATVFIIQGALTVLAHHLAFLTSPWMMNHIDGVGGIIILTIGLNLLKLKSIKTIDMLPSLILIVLYGILVQS